MKNFISDAIENAAVAFGELFKNSMPTYCDIETIDSENVLVSRRGNLVSGIRISGMIEAFGPEEFEQSVARITRGLQSYLLTPAHTIDVFASRDPSGVRANLNQMSEGIKATCEKLSLDLQDVVVSNRKELEKYCAIEEVYLVIWTKSAALSSEQRSKNNAEMGKARQALPKITGGAQSVITTTTDLREKHDSVCKSISQDLRTAGIIAETISAHEMLKIARMSMDPAHTHPDWKPYLIGDALPVASAPAYLRDWKKSKLDFSDLQYPPVSWQMFPRDARRIDSKFVAIGDRAFAPVFVSIPSREVMPFSSLFSKLATSGIPWRVMFRLDGGGMSFFGMKEMIAGLASVATPFNKRIADAMTNLKNVDDSGSTQVRMRISFCTWAPASDLPLLKQRQARLVQTVSAWGQCETRDISGDAMQGMVSTVPFLSESHCGEPSCAPLSHAVRMLPLFRPSSPWDDGNMIFRTEDGKIMPFQPGSSKQATWNYLVAGRPGSGKSVLMSNILMSMCLQPGITRLPNIGIVDIGPSASYFVDMLKDALPERWKHLAASFKLTMSMKHAINPLDLPLGARFPTPETRAFIVNIVTQLATPAEQDKAYSRMSEFVAQVVDNAYLRLSGEHSSSRPKRYSQEVDTVVDAALTKHNYISSKQTSWWEVVDFLFANECIHEATMAQRYAVPIIPDLVEIPQAVKDLYEQIIVESRETLPGAFTSLLSSAIRDFPNMSQPTKFDIGEVRVAAINLEEVAKSGSASADKQTSVMYMLASYCLTKNYRLNEDTVKEMRMPHTYLPYHLEKVRQTRIDLKWIAYDEFHRAKKSEAVENTVQIDLREGRKFNIGVILASQGMDDFSEKIRELSTGVFLADGGTQKNISDMRDYYGLSETSVETLTNSVTGPTSAGAPIFVILSVKEKRYNQLLISTLGVETRWALTTTSEDVAVRKIVTEELGSSKARSILSKVLPNQAQKEVERIKILGIANAVEAVAKKVLDKAG